MVALAAVTLWITRQAKILEQDLDGSAQKIALLDKPAPNFRLTSLDGTTVSLADYLGKKKLVLLFWAPWNNGSRPEMLTLGSLYQRARSADSEFAVAAISVDDDRAAAQAFVSQNQTPFPVLLDKNRSVTNAYQIRSLPTALVISSGGQVEFGSVGFNQRQAFDLAQRLGIRGDFRMEMRGPNAGRGN
jgi:peroxiredoxin